MAQVERVEGQERSFWNSRLFKAGVFLVALGAFFGSFEVAQVGVIATGAAWAMSK